MIRAEYCNCEKKHLLHRSIKSILGFSEEIDVRGCLPVLQQKYIQYFLSFSLFNLYNWLKNQGPFSKDSIGTYFRSKVILLNFSRISVPRSYFPQHFLCLKPLPQGQGSFLPILALVTGTAFIKGGKVALGREAFFVFISSRTFCLTSAAS